MIDFTAINASLKKAGDQAFTFTGTGKFSNTASELRCEKTKADTYVYGDGKADFVLHIDAALTVRAGDFLLYPTDWAVMQQRSGTFWVAAIVMNGQSPKLRWW